MEAAGTARSCDLNRRPMRITCDADFACCFATKILHPDFAFLADRYRIFAGAGHRRFEPSSQRRETSTGQLPRRRQVDRGAIPKRHEE
jgi:hypothetical protein